MIACSFYVSGPRIIGFRKDSPEVIEYALKLAIEATPYTFNSTVLRELAIPLPEISETEKLRRLIGLIDSQAKTAESLGPTEDFVRLQLLLARAEASIDPPIALDAWRRLS